ncbi:MAG: aspartyl/asparaginyl beta-hydroxylase domain-containing protein [Betaproteobacteria bacterium]|nr:aspartyl/asparaginyl beta-hydroxylase domain-containing protein [Betaproteobacteria bacterium]
MNRPALDVRAVAQSGMAALRRGENKRARAEFDRVIETGLADASLFLAMATACRAEQDAAAAMAAVDRALAIDPKYVPALIFKADELSAAGDMRRATAFYLEAVQQVPADAKLSPEMQREIDRAAAYGERFADHAEQRMRAALTAAGAIGKPGDARFDESVDILFGQKKIYIQQPRYYFFPGLPQKQFYDRADFAWMDRVEAATADIRDELRKVLRDHSAFQPYVQGNADRPYRDQQGMLDNADWSAYYLWKNGEEVAEHAARCPNTMAALADAPITRLANRSPSILFSLLQPGAHIPAHNGLVNTRLICHLPLIVPAGCRFRVGNETREWQEGRAWLFDDTIEHEAWNDSGEVRVILLFEIWRPEISERERSQVAALFDAIDTDRGAAPDWEI